MAQKKPEDDATPAETPVEDTADTAGEGTAEDTAQDTTAGPTVDQVGDGMTEQEIRDAGLKIDLPYESPPGDAAPLQYADDLPDEKGWTPPDGFTIAGVPFDEVVAGIGGGAMPQQQTPEVADEQPPQAPEPG